MDHPKGNQVLTGVVLLSGGLLFLIVTLVLSLMSPSPGLFIAPDPIPWVLAALFCIGFIEASVYWLRQSLAIDESMLEYPEANIWSSIGRILQYTDAIISLTILIAVGGILVFFLLVLLGGPLRFTLSTPFLTLVVIYGIYALIRKPLHAGLDRMAGLAGKRLKNYMPRYTLTGRGIIIDLRMKDFGDPSKKYEFPVGFDELDEVRVLTYAEADALVRYRVGPNLDLGLRQAGDLYRYVKGEISRPSVFARVATNRPNVLLKGPAIFYLISFENEDHEELVRVFQDFQKSAVRMGHS